MVYRLATIKVLTVPLRDHAVHAQHSHYFLKIPHVYNALICGMHHKEIN